MDRTFQAPVSVYLRNARTLLAIAACTGTLLALLYLVAGASVMGVAESGEMIDPANYTYNVTGARWFVDAIGILLMGVVIAFAMAASIHAARSSLSFADAYRAITAQSMQIFWLQLVIAALAMQYAPYAVVLLWALTAFVVPAALHENLGPNAATDRAWDASAGRRLYVLFIEFAALIPTAAALYALGYAFLVPNRYLNLNNIPVPARIASSWLIFSVLMVPLQYAFLVLSQAYANATKPHLHAKAATNVR
jgi:hypothetical protein